MRQGSGSGFATLCLSVLLAGMLVVGTRSAVASAHGKHPLVHLVAKVRARPHAPPVGPGLSVAAKRRNARGYLVRDESAFEAFKRTHAFARRLGLVGVGGPLSASVINGWDGVVDDGGTPSDSTGAVGPDRYVELVNFRYGIYDRTGTLLGAGSLADLTGDTNSLTDPQVIWDAATNRFYYTVLDFSTDTLDIGFSLTSSPSSAADFCSYNFDFGYGSELPDYPKLGDTSDFLLVGVNVFTASNDFDGSDVEWIAKPPAGASCPSSLSFGTRTRLLQPDKTAWAFTPVPANQADSSSVGWIVASNINAFTNNTSLSLFQVTNNSGSANIDQIGTAVTVPSFSVPPNAPQAGTSYRLDTLDSRLTQAVSAVDPAHAGATAIWTQHTIGGGAGTLVRWYEINPASHSLLQSGSAVSSALDVFNGAISPDRAVSGATTAYGSSMVLAFNTSSGTTHPAIQMLSKIGSASQTGFVLVKQSPASDIGPDCAFLGYCRWGDYAGATPDPSAPAGASAGRVWLTSMWNTAADPSNFTWGSWNWAAGLNATGISSFTPTSGWVGTTVTINGGGLIGATGVSFNGVPALFSVVSDNQLTATVPAGATSGHISVTTPETTYISTGTFTVLPHITSLVPSTGSGGDPVTINGTGFQGATSVKFNGVAATINAIAPDGSSIDTAVPATATKGYVTVTTATGTATSPTVFTVVPAITSADVLEGPAGTVVTLTGRSFVGVTQVTVGGVTAPFTVLSPTSLRFTVPAAAVSGPIRVTNAGGTATGPTFTVDPKITGFTPTAAAGLASVTIAGTGLAGATEVDFNGDASPLIVSNTATSVVAEVPVDATNGPITVTTAAGTSAPSATVFKPLAKITGFSGEPAQVGDTVTVNGYDFTATGAAPTVKLGTLTLTPGGLSATSFTVAIPDGALTGTLSVTNANGTALSPTPLHVRPTITAAPSPTHGPAGTVVTLVGYTFTGTSKVTVGGVTASFAVVDYHHLHVTIPTAALTGPITVTNAGGSDSSTTFTVDPKITGFTPSSGPTGTAVTISGSGLAGATAVDFAGGVSATPTSSTATTLQVVVPSGALTGTLTVHTASSSATATSGTAFTVTLSLTGITPAIAAVGDKVVLSGIGLTGVMAVKFNGQTATFNIDSDTQITATVPSGSVSGIVTVTKSSVTVSAAQPFALLTLSTISPASAAPGGIVTITGTGFTGATAVTFSGHAASSYTVNSDTKITATVPSGFTGGAGSVVVTADGGSTVSGNLTLLAITGYVPDNAAVGTQIEIDGSGFTAATDVSFNGVHATSFNVTDNTHITATVPVGATTGTVTVTGPGGTATGPSFTVN